MNNNSRCGYISIIGRPNVGKSTLLNTLIGKKISITSRKPQTTRHQILGINTTENVQMIFVDTPGLHLKQNKAINRYMNRTAFAVLQDADLILWVVEALRWDEQDEWILQRIEELAITTPIILVVNKVDQVKNRSELLPFLKHLSQKYKFAHIIPVSAEKNLHLHGLKKEIMTLLPEQPHFFSPQQLTERDDRFIAAEILREKLFRMLGEELPYAITVTLDLLEDRGGIVDIAATIWVEKESQKPIVIGKNGERLKKIGRAARQDLEKFFGKKVFLQQWVKVKANWSDDEALLKFFGY